MHTLVLPLLLLLSPLLPFASPHPQPSALSSPPKYLISDCGPLTSHVSHALDRAVLALPAAISTAGTGIASGNVYTAFFKSNTASKAVVSMLTDIMQMKPIRGRLPYTLKASGMYFPVCKSIPLSPFCLFLLVGDMSCREVCVLCVFCY